MIFNFFKFNRILIIFVTILLLNSCGGGIKLPGADARKVPVNAKDRMAKNLEEGKGFRVNDLGKNIGGGNFEFASSNELWRASLDVIDFMPLVSANYSGGILITDWYSDGDNNESIKINIRFLSNEIRSDALDIDIFYKTCKTNTSCVTVKKESELQSELMREILKKATLYQSNQQKKDFKPYPKLD